MILSEFELKDSGGLPLFEGQTIVFWLYLQLFEEGCLEDGLDVGQMGQA